MSLTSIDAALLQKAFVSGANNISNNKEYINELNVFPVPDGDTGTNMTLTIMAAANEVSAIESPTIASIAKAISGGSLRGARGNSGVILSQLFRGFCREIKDKDELSLVDVVAGMCRAEETAYKAVMAPKEGTILTVAKGMAEKAAELLDTETDIIEFLEKVIIYGDEVLAKTPDMLPVLKEAGVVDSGGQGLMEVMKGVILALKGQPIALTDAGEEIKLPQGAGILDAPKTGATGSSKEDISTADIKFGYCTEFIILLEKELTDDQIDDIKKYLLSLGDSLVCVADEEIVKIHVHTNHPGLAFEKGLEYGQLSRCKVDNMREEHNERVIMGQEQQATEEVPAEPVELAEYGMVSVSVGDGLTQIFKDLGVDAVISGGQTMNPSTDDILSAVEKVNAKNILIFPNNKNIILAANQAASICEDKNIVVIPSKTIPQGIGAVINFDPSASPEENLEAMTEVMQEIKSGEVTFAIRDTSVDGKEIHKNNIMGISDNGIDVVGEDVLQVTKDLIDTLVDEDSGLVSIYYGEDVSEEDAEALGEYLEETYPDLDIDVKCGGQPIYYYLLSVE